MRNTNDIHATIITNMTDLCRWLNNETFVQKNHDVEIVDMKPIKGIANEDCIKLEWRYCKEED